MSQPVTVFIAYAHEDEQWREQLVKNLRPLQWQGLISTWYDREILAGSDWVKKIDAEMNSALVILLLISPDFLASDYCYGIEMKRALERHERREARAIPVILRPSIWEGSPIHNLQVLPQKGVPVTTWENQDSAFVNIVGEIKRVIEEMKVYSKDASITGVSQYVVAPDRQDSLCQTPEAAPVSLAIDEDEKSTTQERVVVDYERELFTELLHLIRLIPPEKIQHLRTTITELVALPISPKDTKQVLQSDPHRKIRVEPIHKEPQRHETNTAKPFSIHNMPLIEWVNRLCLVILISAAYALSLVLCSLGILWIDISLYSVVITREPSLLGICIYNLLSFLFITILVALYITETRFAHRLYAKYGW